MIVFMPWLLRPWWLLALLPLAFIAWRLWRSPRAGEEGWRRIIDAHLLPHVLVHASPRARRAGVVAAIASLLLALLALAGPALEQQPEQAWRRGAVRVLVVELSPQMAPHLERVKFKLLELLRTLPAGETALLVYAEEPYLVVPPTTDTKTIARFVPELAIDAMPAAGNRPERAMRMAADLLARNADGSSGGGDIVWVASAAGAVPAQPPGARLSVLHAATGPALSGPRQGQGVVQPLTADNRDVNRLVEMLAQSGGLHAARSTRAAADVGYWLLPPLLPLAALAFRRGVFVLLACSIALGVLVPPPAQAAPVAGVQALLSDFHGWRLYLTGSYSEAAGRFADPRWRAAALYRAGRYEEAVMLLQPHDDPASHYNRGNALARLGRLADALAAYEASLKQRPDDPDTLHNRNLLRSQMNRNGGGQGKPPPAQQQAGQEADAMAEQWLRGVPDDPGSLLRRKLQIEHQRRTAGEAPRPW